MPWAPAAPMLSAAEARRQLLLDSGVAASSAVLPASIRRRAKAACNSPADASMCGSFPGAVVDDPELLADPHDASSPVLRIAARLRARAACNSPPGAMTFTGPERPLPTLLAMVAALGADATGAVATSWLSTFGAAATAEASVAAAAGFEAKALLRRTAKARSRTEAALSLLSLCRDSEADVAADSDSEPREQARLRASAACSSPPALALRSACADAARYRSTEAARRLRISAFSLSPSDRAWRSANLLASSSWVWP
mmetsp:Transcript_96465/g.241927  ORF Transcript_96465/g.241927 Transcript_96465/m.241927 type:complete len:257 (-) Transcript_96465:134-904(-)